MENRSVRFYRMGVRSCSYRFGKINCKMWSSSKVTQEYTVPLMPKRVKRNTLPKAVLEALTKIQQSLGSSNDINALRIFGQSNWFNVPSCTIPFRKWQVHLTPSDSRNSCTCPAHEIQRIRPCKHVLALKRALEKWLIHLCEVRIIFSHTDYLFPLIHFEIDALLVTRCCSSCGSKNWNEPIGEFDRYLCLPTRRRRSSCGVLALWGSDFLSLSHSLTLWPVHPW